ncbi:sphingosine N-acyltransferase [Malassezia sp. CBS 17886]|nr:sphingosine N-acyltransferase [Malassezia sp. CBS 17886]
MSKGTKRSRRKSKANKSAATTVVPTEALSGKAALSAAGASHGHRRISRWAVGIVVTVAALNWLTSPLQYGPTRALEHVWHALAQHGIDVRMSAADAAAALAKVHVFTSACLFLSSRITPVAPAASMSAWLGALWSRTTGSSVAEPVLYVRDRKDALFVVFWGIVLVAIRGVLMDNVLHRIARRVVQPPAANHGDAARRARRYGLSTSRFTEQAWIAILYLTSLCLVLVSARAPFPLTSAKTTTIQKPFWPWHLKLLWVDYPHARMDALTKTVYLWQISNYIHQLITINVEERRSDYWYMTVHHVVTIFLIGGSYACCLTNVGLAILLLMDPSDVLLALAKMLKYMGWQTLCDAMFVAFMLTWTITRHVLFLLLMYSCVTEAPAIVPFKSPVDFASGYVFTKTSFGVFLALLGLLQAILMLWYSMIIGVAWRVVTSNGATDSRSDDED